MSRRVMCGRVAMGGGAPVSIQSMTNTDTRDAAATLAQVRALAAAGCDIVRISVYDEACARAMREIRDGSPTPLVADVHFDYRLAVLAVENGADKLRINPGNIGGERRVQKVADCARAHGVPIRVGVNSGSVEKELLRRYGGPTPRAMLESALAHVRMLEACGFYDVVVSIKASSVRETVEANRLLARACEYPLHIGVTEAGLPGRGTVKSAIGAGALLLDGIGDTLRVSLSGDPLQEPAVALEILRSLGLRGGVNIIACPTCGRTCLDVAGVARKIEEATRLWPERLTVAVMGCVVNGPGEAREADVGIAGGPDGFALFRRGEKPVRGEGDPAQALLSALEALRGKA
ncbi:MAG TPA: flavodoxin-dependent (E)-4-hydroxy-3-methylbut-2-enyl-diphosphate synthase [Candidatus Avichristensenella intestinipullorum]|uniref:4-hydroxy-3-methylbut-2-en-1-yl diphosphate synthase (flavodoxin) n=1 Tax=Candidatus Avichristensenella intestinipullorum TaxID=2840693 RepID=A0A9D0YX94_9FIRM|nr:flavodoxin-dependent (E)-4-hydroxy-3-methylbut-2-enyl-diphosphate synthase [Candidatus Avichristensenella intestinipullorum]